jgi:hypothetical protein
MKALKKAPTLGTVLKAVCHLAGRIASPFSMYLLVLGQCILRERENGAYPKARRKDGTERTAPLIWESKPLFRSAFVFEDSEIFSPGYTRHAPVKSPPDHSWAVGDKLTQ